MEDRRAHDRIDTLEVVVENHIREHNKFEASLSNIEANTAELVELVRGAKGLRSLIVWAAPIVAFLAAVYAWAQHK